MIYSYELTSALDLCLLYEVNIQRDIMVMEFRTLNINRIFLLDLPLKSCPTCRSMNNVFEIEEVCINLLS